MTNEERAYQKFLEGWNAALEGADLEDPDGAEKFEKAVTGTEVTLAAPGDSGRDAETIFNDWFSDVMGQREVYLNPKALTQQEIDRHGWAEGTPERAYLDWMGYPRPSWMKEA